MAARQFLITFPDGDEFDATPHIPQVQGVYLSPTKHMLEALRLYRPERVAEYENWQSRREWAMARLEKIMRNKNVTHEDQDNAR